jgi:hypothetical protein
LKGSYGDYRNWQEIDAWAEDIARQLAGGEAVPAESYLPAINVEQLPR